MGIEPIYLVPQTSALAFKLYSHLFFIFFYKMKNAYVEKRKKIDYWFLGLDIKKVICINILLLN